MLPKWIVKNKYKLMLSIIGLYLAADLVTHKGLVRVLIQAGFPVHHLDTSHSKNNIILINTGKEWVKAVNSAELMSELAPGCSGLECDVYFNKSKNYFDVHHDKSAATGLNLDKLLSVYHQKGLQASVWLDLKNLRDTNYREAVTELVRLKNKYGLEHKLLVESNRVLLLRSFSDSGFYTSYYAPPFNPYFCSDDSLRHWADYISGILAEAHVNAISGYYYQYPFLRHFFPNYPILIWPPNDRFSIVNWWYKRKVLSDKGVFIALYP